MARDYLITSNSQTRKITFWLFATVSALQLVAVTFELTLVQQVTKPLIMPTLALLFLVRSAHVPLKAKVLMLLAMAFSCVGDCLLMLVNMHAMMFIAGLGAFLVAHIMYIALFNVAIVKRYKKRVVIRRPVLALPLIIYGFIVYDIIFPKLGALMLPVLAYVLIIIAMGLSAQNRRFKTSTASFWHVFGGALLFVVSDSVLGVNKFLYDGSLPLGGLLVMSTYIVGQWYIAEGIVKHYDDVAAGFRRVQE